MKKLYLIALSLFTATMALASPGAHSISTNAVTVLPARPISNAPVWSTNTVAAIGNVFLYTDYQNYMAKASGALPAAPDSNYVKVFSGSRGFATVQNTGTTDIWVAFGTAAVLDSGLKLVPGAVVSVKDYQGLISTVSSAAGGTVATTEVPK